MHMVYVPHPSTARKPCSGALSFTTGAVSKESYLYVSGGLCWSMKYPETPLRRAMWRTSSHDATGGFLGKVYIHVRFFLFFNKHLPNIIWLEVSPFALSLTKAVSVHGRNRGDKLVPLPCGTF